MNPVTSTREQKSTSHLNQRKLIVYAIMDIEYPLTEEGLDIVLTHLQNHYTKKKILSFKRIPIENLKNLGFWYQNDDKKKVNGKKISLKFFRIEVFDLAIKEKLILKEKMNITKNTILHFLDPDLLKKFVDNNEVLISGIPARISKENIYQIFSKLGKIKKIKFFRRREKTQNFTSLNKIEDDGNFKNENSNETSQKTIFRGNLAKKDREEIRALIKFRSPLGAIESILMSPIHYKGSYIIAEVNNNQQKSQKKSLKLEKNESKKFQNSLKNSESRFYSEQDLSQNESSLVSRQRLYSYKKIPSGEKIISQKQPPQISQKLESEVKLKNQKKLNIEGKNFFRDFQKKSKISFEVQEENRVRREKLSKEVKKQIKKIDWENLSRDEIFQKIIKISEIIFLTKRHENWNLNFKKFFKKEIYQFLDQRMIDKSRWLKKDDDEKLMTLWIE